MLIDLYSMLADTREKEGDIGASQRLSRGYSSSAISLWHSSRYKTLI